jgi:hypothetical protein
VPLSINQNLYTNAQQIICELGVRCLLGGKYIRKIDWFNKLSVGAVAVPQSFCVHSGSSSRGNFPRWLTGYFLGSGPLAGTCAV